MLKKKTVPFIQCQPSKSPPGLQKYERIIDRLSYPKTVKGLVVPQADMDQFGGSEGSTSPKRNEQAIENDRMVKKLKEVKPTIDSLKLPFQYSELVDKKMRDNAINDSSPKKASTTTAGGKMQNTSEKLPSVAARYS